MPIMIESLSSISPTITLAQLFGEQRHFLAAYAIYRYLSLKKPNEEVIEGMKEIAEKAFGETHNEKLLLLPDIFTDEDAEKLGIVPAKLYHQIREVCDELLKKDTTELGTIDMEGEHLFSNIQKRISSEWQEIISADYGKKDTKSKAALTLNTIDWSDIKLADFITFLLSIPIEEKKLDKVKLSVIMETFLKQYRRTDE